MGRPHAFLILALSIAIFALSLSAAVIGRPRESIYADPGRTEAAGRR